MDRTAGRRQCRFRTVEVRIEVVGFGRRVEERRED